MCVAKKSVEPVESVEPMEAAESAAMCVALSSGRLVPVWEAPATLRPRSLPMRDPPTRLLSIRQCCY